MCLEPLQNEALFVGVLARQHHGDVPGLEVLHRYTAGPQLREVSAGLHGYAAEALHLLRVGALGAVGGLVHQDMVQQVLEGLVGVVRQEHLGSPGTASSEHRGDISADDDT